MLRRTNVWGWATLCLSGVAGLVAQAEEPKTANEYRVQIRNDPSPQVFAVRVGDIVAEKYWIGVMSVPVDPTLKAQLKLEGGLAVRHVLPDSPAAKAGIQEHDLLLKVQDTTVKGLPDLIRALNASEGKSVQIELLRQGETRTLEVTPVERPHPQVVSNELQIRTLGQPGTTMTVVQPGFVWKQPELPEGTSLTIRKEGSAPAQIQVRRGEEKWEVTENDLSKLPEDLRQAVSSMLQQAPVRRFDALDVQPAQTPAPHGEPPAAGLRVEAHPVGPNQVLYWYGAPLPALPSPSTVPAPQPPSAHQPSQLEEIRSELKQLRAAIEELRQAKPEKK